MEPRALAAFVGAREGERGERNRRRRDALLQAIPALSRTLVEEYGASRVILFGSLVWGEPDERSDIDLATVGLPSESYFEALGALLALAPCGVDLVRLEEAAPALRRRIKREGVRVHDRADVHARLKMLTAEIEADRVALRRHASTIEDALREEAWAERSPTLSVVAVAIHHYYDPDPTPPRKPVP